MSFRQIFTTLPFSLDPQSTLIELLTDREKEIADELIIGTSTVKTHTLNIYRKLDIGSRT